MTTVEMKSGDIGPGKVFENPSPLTIDGTTADLTTATSILFLLKAIESPYTAYSLTGAVNGTATAGNVKYVVAAGFPTTPGKYKQEWEITFSDGTKHTFPSDDYNYVEIIPDLN